MIKLHKQKQGFTLIELSIAIVIIGVLIAGIVIGRNLIERAKLGKLASEIVEVQRAVKLFQDSYSALPGDYNGPRSTKLSGSRVCAEIGQSDAIATSPATDYSHLNICPGDADGVIDVHNHDQNVLNYEYIYARNHLVSAKFLPAEFSLRTASNFNWHNTFPKSYTGLNRVYWSFYDIYIELFRILNDYKAFDIDMAYKLDLKIDDGKATKGIIVNAGQNTTTTGVCTQSNYDECSCIINDDYDLNTYNKSCIIKFNLSK